jgi:serpin B
LTIPSATLALAFAGARGETQTQISNVLQFPAIPNDVSQAMAELQELLSAADAVEGVDLNIASGLWVDNSQRLLDDFVNHSKQLYDASPNRVDFQGNPDIARQTINRWVEKQTNTKIRNLIQEDTLNSLTRLLLVTATYFKGIWAKQFKNSETQESQFNIAHNKSTQVPFMTQQQRFLYTEFANLQILELPYVDNRLSMILLLPKELDGLPDLENILTSSILKKWTAALKPMLVRMYLPKFKMNLRLDLGQTLSAMGMPDAFESQADFSGISESDNLRIAAIFHQAFLEFTEEGTQAAGSTGVVMEGRSLRAPQPVVFRADHAFLYIIRENQSGAILFLGRLVDPDSSKSEPAKKC